MTNIATLDPNAVIAASKKRSYRVRVKPGDHVEFLTSLYRSNGRVKSGTVGTVVSETNAGFRGIVCSVRVDGELYCDVSTGILMIVNPTEVQAAA